MSTEFDTGFLDGDTIEKEHVIQYATHIHEIESGKAFFRVDVSATAGVYKVEFDDLQHNGIENLEDGQMIHFKALTGNTSGATSLAVVGTASPTPLLGPLLEIGRYEPPKDRIEMSHLVRSRGSWKSPLLFAF